MSGVRASASRRVIAISTFLFFFAMSGARLAANPASGVVEGTASDASGARIDMDDEEREEVGERKGRVR